MHTIEPIESPSIFPTPVTPRRQTSLSTESISTSGDESPSTVANENDDDENDEEEGSTRPTSPGNSSPEMMGGKEQEPEEEEKENTPLIVVGAGGPQPPTISSAYAPPSSSSPLPTTDSHIALPSPTNNNKKKTQEEEVQKFLSPHPPLSIYNSTTPPRYSFDPDPFFVPGGGKDRHALKHSEFGFEGADEFSFLSIVGEGGELNQEEEEKDNNEDRRRVKRLEELKKRVKNCRRVSRHGTHSGWDYYLGRELRTEMDAAVKSQVKIVTQEEDDDVKEEEGSGKGKGVTGGSASGGGVGSGGGGGHRAKSSSTSTITPNNFQSSNSLQSPPTNSSTNSNSKNPTPKSKSPHMDEEPTHLILLTTYYSYVILILIGHLRDWFARRVLMKGEEWGMVKKGGAGFDGLMEKDGIAPLTSDWDSFYTRRLKSRIEDLFARPVTSVPGRTIILLPRIDWPPRNFWGGGANGTGGRIEWRFEVWKKGGDGNGGEERDRIEGSIGAGVDTDTDINDSNTAQGGALVQKVERMTYEEAIHGTTATTNGDGNALIAQETLDLNLRCDSLQALNVSSYNYLGFAQSRGWCTDWVAENITGLPQSEASRPSPVPGWGSGWKDHHQQQEGVFDNNTTTSSSSSPPLALDPQSLSSPPSFLSSSSFSSNGNITGVHAGYTGSVRGEVGTWIGHVICDRLVAKFMGTEDAMTVSQGFATNSANIPALAGKGDLILSDQLNHASIRYGARLSGAMVRQYSHNDMADLERVLREAISDGQPPPPLPGSNKRRQMKIWRPWNKILVVVEGIYSMEGTVVELPSLLELKKKYKFYLYLDEAHSIGALGPGGRGVCDYFGVNPREVDVLMGTFTKSFGAAGGYLAGSHNLITALRNFSYATHYAEPPTPAVVCQIVASMSLIMGPPAREIVPGLPAEMAESSEGTERLRRLAFNARYLSGGLRRLGFLIYGSRDSPIIPLLVCHPAKLPLFSRAILERHRIAVVMVGYPATPLVTSRVRFCVSAAHTKSDLDRLLIACDDVGGMLGLKSSNRPPGGRRWTISEVLENWEEVAHGQYGDADDD